MKKIFLFLMFVAYSLAMSAQINTDRVLAIGRNALYFEDYVLSIQYFKPLKQNLGSRNPISTALLPRSIWTIIRERKKTVRYVSSGIHFWFRLIMPAVLPARARKNMPKRLPTTTKVLNLNPKTARCLLIKP